MCISVLDVEIDEATKRVTRAGKQLYFTPREYDLLLLFARHANRVLTRDTIRQGWFEDRGHDSNLVDVYVRYLRKKLGAPTILHTRRGKGYVFGVDYA